MGGGASKLVGLLTVVVVLAVSGPAGAAPAATSVGRAGTIQTYRYEITVAGSGQTTSLLPYQPYGISYTGSVSGTFSVVYQVAITLDTGAQTIAAHSLNPYDTASDPNPVELPGAEFPHSLSVGGTLNFDVTAMCAGYPCTGPPTTCAFSTGDISAYYTREAGRLWMPGLEQADHADYAAGTFWLEQDVNGPLPNPPPTTNCHSGNFSPADPIDIPGFTDGVPYWRAADNHGFVLPLADIGKPLIQHTFTPEENDCAMDFVEAVCTAQATVTMKLLPNPSTMLHVGFVDVSESERIQRLVTQLEPQINSLTAQKATLEQEIAAQTQRATDDSTKVDDLTAQLPQIAAALTQEQPFLAQLSSSETALPADVKKELQQEEELAARLGELQNDLVGARDSGDQTTAQHVQKQVASLQKLVDQLVGELHGKLSSLDPTLDKWLTATRYQQQRLSTIQLQLASAMFDREEAADTLESQNRQRTLVDEELNSAVEKFLAVDFLPDVVTVTDPSGGVVFKADVSKRAAAQLDEIDKDLAAAAPADAQLEKQRKQALKDFLDAERLSSTALTTLTDTIMNVAYKKAAVDFAYNAYDVLKASAKGGLVGAVSETLKKVVEAIAIEAYESGGGQLLSELRHPGVPWGRSASDHFWIGSAKELDARFQTDAKLSNQYFADQARKVAGQRIFKDSVTGPGKDLLNKSLGAAVLKWWKDVPFPAGSYGPQQELGSLTQLKNEIAWIKGGYKTWLETFTKHSSHIKELSKGSKLLNALSLVKAGSTKRVLEPVAGDLLAGFFKDVSKNVWKGYYDLQEQRAWQNYFEKEAAAQALYLPWQQASIVYDAVHATVQGLEADKANLLVGYDPAHGTKVLVDKKFKTGTKLTVSLKLYRPTGGTNTIAFDVVLGARSAGDAGKYAYSVATDDLTEGQSGLGLTITAN